jgi:hypothetical protein
MLFQLHGEGCDFNLVVIFQSQPDGAVQTGVALTCRKRFTLKNYLKIESSHKMLLLL